MYVYNSECQTLSNSSNGILTADIKEGFCFIDGRCVPNRRQKRSSEVYCLPEISLYSWSALRTSTETPITTTTSVIVAYLVDSKSIWQIPVIVAVGCIFTICIIVSLMIYIRKRKRRKTKDKKKEKEELTVNFKHEADFDEETYAHINPIDVCDDEPGNKTTKFTLGSADDYSRLDISKKEKTQFAKLNARDNNGRGGGPMLPERPNENYQDPYEKLRSRNQKQEVYDKMQTDYRYLHSGTNETKSEPFKRFSNEAQKEKDYLKLDGNDYLTPTEGNEEMNKELPRHIFVVRMREGYERPYPQLYKQY